MARSSLKWLILVQAVACAEPVKLSWTNAVKDVKGKPVEIVSTRVRVDHNGKTQYFTAPSTSITLDIQPCSYLAIQNVSKWGVISNPAPLSYKPDDCT